MSRALLILANDEVRQKAALWCQKLPVGTRVTFNKPKRSLDQNALLWSRLTEIATQVEWHGMKLSPEDWKTMFMDALKREMRTIPNIDGNGFVILGRSSSDLSKEEFADLLTITEMFAAKHGVVFGERDE